MYPITSSRGGAIHISTGHKPCEFNMMTLSPGGAIYISTGRKLCEFNMMTSSPGGAIYISTGRKPCEFNMMTSSPGGAAYHCNTMAKTCSPAMSPPVQKPPNKIIPPAKKESSRFVAFINYQPGT